MGRGGCKTKNLPWGEYGYFLELHIADIVIPWIIKLGFCSIHFTVTLAGLKNVNDLISIKTKRIEMRDE